MQYHFVSYVDMQQVYEWVVYSYHILLKLVMLLSKLFMSTSFSRFWGRGAILIWMNILSFVMVSAISIHWMGWLILSILWWILLGNLTRTTLCTWNQEYFYSMEKQCQVICSQNVNVRRTYHRCGWHNYQRYLNISGINSYFVTHPGIT